MKKDTIQDRLEDTAHDLHEYGNLQLEALKLKLLEKLSVFLNNVFSSFILVFLGAIALIFVAVVLTLLLADLMGSLLAATAVMAGVFVVATLIVYLCRKKMFINMMVRMTGKMLFEKEKEED